MTVAKTATNNQTPRPPRPLIAAPNFDAIPAALRALPYWALWRWKWNAKREEWVKMPTGLRLGKLTEHGSDVDRFVNLDVTNLENCFAEEGPRADMELHWIDFDTTRSLWGQLNAKWPGIVGMAFNLHGTGVAGADLDKVRDRTTGEITPEAQAVIAGLGTYAEVSPSGTGVKLLLRGRKPGTRCRTIKHKVEIYRKIEVYDRCRFFTITGAHVPGTPTEVMDRQAELDALYRELFPDEPDKTPRRNEATAQEAPAESPNNEPPEPPLTPSTLDDEQLIARAKRANDDGKFERLWNGDTSDCGGDKSSADFTLAIRLAFWCGPDADRIERLMRKSELRRKKWDERRPGGTWLNTTIRNAVSKCRTFYGAGARLDPADIFADDPDHKPIQDRIEFDPWPKDYDPQPAINMAGRRYPKGQRKCKRFKKLFRSKTTGKWKVAWLPCGGTGCFPCLADLKERWDIRAKYGFEAIERREDGEADITVWGPNIHKNPWDFWTKWVKVDGLFVGTIAPHQYAAVKKRLSRGKKGIATGPLRPVGTIYMHVDVYTREDAKPGDPDEYLVVAGKSFPGAQEKTLTETIELVGQHIRALPLACGHGAVTFSKHWPVLLDDPPSDLEPLNCLHPKLTAGLLDEILLGFDRDRFTSYETKPRPGRMSRAFNEFAVDDMTEWDRQWLRDCLTIAELPAADNRPTCLHIGKQEVIVSVPRVLEFLNQDKSTHKDFGDTLHFDLGATTANRPVEPAPP
jgi:primase-polymerase (primpol)-like protein